MEKSNTKKDNYSIPISFDSEKHESIQSIWWTGVFLKKDAKKLFQPYVGSESQFIIMAVLKSADSPMTQNDLSKKLSVDKSNITSVLKRMEKDGLIKKNHVRSDKRRHHVNLTKKGEEVYDKLYKMYIERINEIMKDFSDEESKTLIKLLEKIRSNLD